MLRNLNLVDPKTKKPVKSSYHRLDCPNWVNTFVITKEKKLILVEQRRAGTFEMTLESPGGVIDPGEDPKRAALRELEEETGYTCRTI